MTLSGKVAFITGAAQGLGKAFAEGLLELGVKVFLADVNSVVGTATLAEFKKRFPEDNIRFVAFDVTDYQQFEDAFNLAVSTFGHVDVMVSNAGVLGESNFQPTINTNYTSVVFGTYLAVEHMRKDKGGRGGRITSVLPEQQPNIEEQGIEFGILCPDTVFTPMNRSIRDGQVLFLEDAKKFFQTNPLPVSVVVDAFLELLQLEKLNGAILQVTREGKSYRRMENHVA